MPVVPFAGWLLSNTVLNRGGGIVASRFVLFLKDGLKRVAKTSPGEFIRQVRQEASKIVWPSGRETMVTAIMVVIMTSLLAIFFFGTDTFFGWVVRMLLSLASGQ